MKKFLKRRFAHPKKQGSSLLIAVFLSGLILTIGITASRLMLKEVGFAADNLRSEKAYYHAESGVENALLELRNEPVQHIDLTAAPPSLGVEYDLSIINKIKPVASGKIQDTFSFILPKFGNQQFRLRYDQNNGATASISAVSNFDLSVNAGAATPVKYQWKITCQDTAGVTQTILKTETATTISNFLDRQGCLSTDSPPLTFLAGDPCKGEPLQPFSTWTGITPNTCFISFQNLEDTDTTFTFTNGTMAGHQAKVISVGKSQNREKHIVFDYAQKNIGSLFNFTFFHTEIGL